MSYTSNFSDRIKRESDYITLTIVIFTTSITPLLKLTTQPSHLKLKRKTNKLLIKIWTSSLMNNAWEKGEMLCLWIYEAASEVYEEIAAKQVGIMQEQHMVSQSQSNIICCRGPHHWGICLAQGKCESWLFRVDSDDFSLTSPIPIAYSSPYNWSIPILFFNF